MRDKFSYWADNLVVRHPSTKLLTLLGLVVLHLFAGVFFYSYFVGEGELVSDFWKVWTYIAKLDDVSETTNAGRLIAIFITTGGFLLFAVLITLVNDALRTRVDALKQGRSQVFEKGHTLILGWSDRIPPLINEICIANQSTGSGVLVILSHKSKEDMEREIEQSVPDLRGSKIVCRTGSSMLRSDLKNAAVESARSIIILSDDTTGEADLETIRTVLAICKGLKNVKGQIVAELDSVETQSLVQTIGGEKVQCVVDQDQIGRMMIKASRQPGLAQVYNELLGFQGNEFYLKNWPELSGMSFRDIYLIFPQAVVCGLLPKGSSNFEICPPDTHILNEGDELLVLAWDDTSYKPAKPVNVDPGKLPELKLSNQKSEKTLLCGWRDDVANMILELDKYVVSGSELTILNELPLEKRNAVLEPNGNGPLKIQNQTLIHEFGNPVEREVLERLDLGEYDSILVFSDQAKSERMELKDSRSLASLLTIRAIQKNLKKKKNTIIISEVCDPRTKDLLSVANVSDFVISNELISLILSTVSENGKFNSLWNELLSPDGNEIYLNNVNQYVMDGEELSFWQLSVRARLRKEIVLGYVVPKEEGMIVLNPSDKNTARRWNTGEYVITIASD